MKKGLRSIIGTGLFIMGSAGFLGGCTGMGAVMSTSDDPRARLVGTLMYHEGAHEERMKEAREGRTNVKVYGRETYNSEERAILNHVKSMPRVIYQGINSEGIEEWIYYDGKGNRHRALNAFVDDENHFEFGQDILDKYGVRKNEKFYKKTFVYPGEIKTASGKIERVFSVVPDNTLRIYHQK